MQFCRKELRPRALARFLPPRVREWVAKASVSLGADGKAVRPKVRCQKELADRIADIWELAVSNRGEDNGLSPSSLALEAMSPL